MQELTVYLALFQGSPTNCFEMWLLFVHYNKCFGCAFISIYIYSLSLTLPLLPIYHIESL